MYRIEKFTIETPKPGVVPFIGITLQKVLFDDEGKVKEIIPRHDVLYVKETDLAGEKIELHDPVYDEDIHISGEGVWQSLLLIGKQVAATKPQYDIDEDGNLVDA